MNNTNITWKPSVNGKHNASDPGSFLIATKNKDSRLSHLLDGILMATMQKIEVPYTIMLEKDYVPEPWCLKFARSVLGDYMVPPRKNRVRSADASPQRPLRDSQSFQKGMTDCWCKVRKSLRPNAIKRATNDAAGYVTGLKAKFD